MKDVVVTLGDRKSEVSGFVRDEQGKTLENGWVFLFPQERESWTFVSSAIATRIQKARPRPQGTYRFTALPGNYFVAAVSSEAPEFWQTPDFLQKLTRAAVKVTIDAGGQVQQNLTAVPIR